MANKLLNAEFSVFTHMASGTTAIRALAYSLPAGLENVLDVVFPAVS
jgi:tripeptidyl-peptidase-1